MTCEWYFDACIVFVECSALLEKLHESTLVDVFGGGIRVPKMG